MRVTEGEESVSCDETDASVPAPNVFVDFTDGGKHRGHVEVGCVADLEVACTTVQRHGEHVEQEF